MTNPRFIATPCDTCRGDGYTGFGPWCLRPKCEVCVGRGWVVLPAKVPMVPDQTGCTKSYVTGDSEPYNIGTGCACHEAEWHADDPFAGCDECRDLHPPLVAIPDPLWDPDRPCDVPECWLGQHSASMATTGMCPGRRTAPIVIPCDYGNIFNTEGTCGIPECHYEPCRALDCSPPVVGRCSWTLAPVVSAAVLRWWSKNPDDFPIVGIPLPASQDQRPFLSTRPEHIDSTPLDLVVSPGDWVAIFEVLS